MTRVLITGGTGFIGRHCLRQLLDRGWEIHALAHESTNDGIADVVWHRGDLFEESMMRRLIERIQPTHLLHLAWMATPGIFWNSPLNHQWVVATTSLFNAFRASGGRRFVGVGSCGEYDWTNGLCAEDSDCVRPSTIYGQCKREAYDSLLRLAAAGSCSFGWARLFWTFGAHEPTPRLVPAAINRLLRGEPAYCTAGTQQRDFLYVKDVARALVDFLVSNIQGPVNIASGQPVTVSAVVGLLGRLTHRPDLIRFGSASDEPPLVVAAVDRLHNELRFAPQYSLESALQETIDWWKCELSRENQFVAKI
jgi:nucleoside-diphosphate-sugar epimerase